MSGFGTGKIMRIRIRMYRYYTHLICTMVAVGRLRGS